MEQAGYFETKRFSPTAVAAAIAIEAAVFVGVASWQLDAIPVIKRTPTEVRLIPVPKPEDSTPQPKAQTRTEAQQRTQIAAEDTLIQLPPIGTETVGTGDPPVGDTGTGPGPVVDYLPVTPPPPTIRPAKAKGNIENLISTDDYPEAARRRDEAGTVRARLEISPAGNVTGCSVLASSGSATLDSTTCRLLKARAHFTPATDQTGHAVAGSFVTPKIIWRLDG